MKIPISENQFGRVKIKEDYYTKTYTFYPDYWEVTYADFSEAKQMTFSEFKKLGRSTMYWWRREQILRKQKSVQEEFEKFLEKVNSNERDN
jgi:hypothetical protein